MKYLKNLPAIGLYVYLAYMSIFIVAGFWHFFLNFCPNYGYIRAVKNLSMVATSILIIWIMRIYFKRTYATFHNSVKHFKKTLGISIATLIVVFFSYSFNIYLFSNLGAISISLHPDFWASTNFYY